MSLVSSIEDGVKKAGLILVLRVKNKKTDHRYQKIGEKTRLKSTQLKLFGSIDHILFGSFKGKTFNGVFQWENLAVYNAEGDEIGTKDNNSLESGEEGSIEEGQKWIVFVRASDLKGSPKLIPFFRAESEGSRDRVLSIVCKTKKLRQQMPGAGKEHCQDAKRDD